MNTEKLQNSVEQKLRETQKAIEANKITLQKLQDNFEKIRQANNRGNYYKHL